MELEQKSPELSHPTLDDNSHPNDPNQPGPTHIDDEINPQGHNSPKLTSSNPMSTNFDETPLPAKATLTFEELLEASLKSSGNQPYEPGPKREPVSRPPKPKVTNPKFNKGAAKKPSAQGKMEEESNFIVESKDDISERAKPDVQAQREKMQDVQLGSVDDLLAEDNRKFQNIDMEEEKTEKPSNLASQGPIEGSLAELDKAEGTEANIEETVANEHPGLAKKFSRGNTGEIGSATKIREAGSFNEMPLNKPIGDQGFDDMPVGKTGGGINMSEYPEGMQPFEEEQAPQDTGPLQSRVKSKVWKVRQNAFEELTQKFLEADREDNIFDEYVSDLPKFLSDANPGSQEKAIEAFKVYIEKKDGSGIDAKSSTKVLIDKALAPGKPNIRKVCLETLCLMLEKMDTKDIIEGLVDSINHKNQKVSCAGVQAVVELLMNYGPKKLEFLKPFFPAVEKLAGSTVSSQRAEAMTFYREAYKFMRDALKPFIANLKKAQLDELEKFFAECPKDIPRPLKGGDAGAFKGASGKAGAQGGEAQGKGSAVYEDMGTIDAYEISDPVDLFKKYNDTWSEKVLANAKWNEKKTMMEELLKDATNTPRIAPTPFPHITNMLKKLLGDSNQNVMVTAIKIYSALAKGLRRNLSNGCKNIFPTILAKLKDKRQVVVDETARTLENFYYCINLDEVLEDVKELLVDKTPAAKVQALKWIEKYFERNVKSPEKVGAPFKGLLPTLKKLLDDGAAEVREATLVTLARLKTLVPENVLRESYNDINPVKLNRINELAANIADGVSIDTTGKGASSSLSGSMVGIKKKPSLTLSGDAIEEEKSGTGTAIKRPASRAGDKLDNKPQTSKAGASGAKQLAGGLKRVDSVKSLGSAQGGSSNKEEVATSTLCADDAESKMVELNLPESIMKALESSAWKEKQQALEEFGGFVRDNAGAVSPYIEHAFKFIKTKMKDWKESNLNVIKEALQTIATISSNSDITLTKRSFSIIAPFVVNNLHDAKYKELCSGIVTSFVESINPKTVILTVINNFSDSKDSKVSKVNPKALAETCLLLAKLLETLTLSFFPLKETIDFAKTTLANQNIAARNAATALFKAIYQQLGAPLNDFLNDVNPQTLKTLQAEFEKIVPNKNVQCKINFRGEAQKDVKEMGTSSSNPLDSLPRADISRDVDKLLKKLNDGDWKVRKEGLEAVEAIISSNSNRIAPNGLQDFVGALKKFLNDNNKSLLKTTIIFVGNFATALGSNVKLFSKTLVGELARNLSDKQAVIRTETLATMDKFAMEIGSEIVINNAFPLLSQENPELRLTLIPWILRNQESLAKIDLKAHVNIVLSILQDKTKEIRNLGERLLEKCIANIGPAPYLAALKDFKPAIQNALTPLVQKYASQSSSQMEPEVEVEAQNGSFDQKQGQKTLKKTPSESSLKTTKPLLRPATASGSFTQETLNAPEPKKGERATSPKKDTSGLSSSGLNSSRTSGGMLYQLGQKNKRQEDEKKNKWNTEELKDDLVERLKENLKKNVSGDLYQKMFSFDARKQIEAIQSLKKALVQEPHGTTDILDLIFRWLFWKLWDTANMQVTKEALDYVFNLVLYLETANYTLEDFELNVLVPFLLQKLATGQQNSKLTLHKIFQKLGEITYPSKVGALLVQNVQSKNTKTRNEALEMLPVMIKEYKTEALAQKDIKALGKLLGHNETVVKNLAFTALVELGGLMKDELIRILRGEAPQKSLDLLQQRIKTTEGGSRQEKRGYSDDFSGIESSMFEGSNRGQNIISGSFLVDKEDKYDPENVENRDISNAKTFYGTQGNRDKVEPTSFAERDNARDTRDSSLLGTPQNPTKGIHVVGGQRIEEELFDRSLSLLINGSISNRLDALLLIHDIVTADNEETKEFLRTRADDLVRTLYVTLKNVFEKSNKEIPVKFILYFLNMTHKLCSIRSFLKNVSEENLRIFTEEILNRLLSEDEEKRFESTTTESPVKTLNSIMLRVLENAEPNIMFNVLFDLLIKNRRIYPSQYAKILGLIVKCILKLTKALSQISNTLQTDKILLKFHAYILEFGVKQPDDIGIKTIKQLLHELVKTYGEGIWTFYERSVRVQGGDEYIHKWIGVILRHIANGGKDEQIQDFQDKPTPDRRESGELRKKQENIPPQSSQLLSQFPTQNSQTLSQLLNSDILDTKTFEIRQIIENLKTSDDLEGGIRQLHKALQKYPGLSVSPYLRNCTPAFSDYILKALERLDNQEQSRSLLGSQETEPKSQQLKLDETRFRFDKPLQETNSPRDSAPLSLEDFQNKVNTLKARYGLILKKSNEAQETAAKPTQTTYIYKNSQTNTSKDFIQEPRREPERSIRLDQEPKEREPVSFGGFGGIGNMTQSVMTSAPSNTAVNTDSGLGVGASAVGSSILKGLGESKPATTNAGDNATGRSTENILQRLNEMKMKMANIINSNKQT